MKRFFTTMLFACLALACTTVYAQEAVDFSTGTLDGEWGDKDTRSIWTSANGLKIVSTDANGNEVGSMKYWDNKFTLYINNGVATPVKYTITVPEGYSLTEMKVKNSTKSHDAHVDYDLSSYDLSGTTAEKTIQFVEGVNEFYLYGQVGRTIYLTSLTITKAGGEDATGINSVETGNNDVIFDLSGNKVNKISQKGIYIINGKKVVK